MTTSTPTDKQIKAAAFLSWASDDKGLKEDLLVRLSPHLAIFKEIEFAWWEMSDIQAGKRWRQDILARIAECSLGVSLISPHFMASGFIRSEEIPPFFGAGAVKKVVPVGLRPISFDAKAYNLLGVDEQQIFRLDGKSFSELRGHKRDAFALKLADQIRARILDLPEWHRP